MTTYLLATVALAIIGGGVWLYARAHRAGRATAELDQVGKALKSSKAGAQAAANAPRDRDEVVERLRGKGL